MKERPDVRKKLPPEAVASAVEDLGKMDCSEEEVSAKKRGLKMMEFVEI